ncbi:MAG: hypothetical protein LBK58_11270 [Prevotellaceae bacterium]|jgi:hypothetical protein|nr:hypothetical protein [Prevotellaceae bacterium]
MKYRYILLSLLFICFSCTKEVVAEEDDDSQSVNIEPDYRNFYGITWVGNNDDNLAYAKQMGYDYIFYHWEMADHEFADSLKFYLETPQYDCYNREINRANSFTGEEKEYLSRFAALKDAFLPFPENLARGWFFEPSYFSVEPDLQQQRVIDFLVDSILNRAASLERKDKGFEFGGYAWDVPQLYGDFWDTIQVSGGNQVTLAHWTGHDSGDKHPDVMHEYQTYSEGHASFYRTLWKKTKERFPDARFIVEPWHPYDDWLRYIENQPDADELIPDLIVQEKDGIDFATDENILKSRLVDNSMLGCTSPNVFTEEGNRKIAGTAASIGSTFGWYGRFGGTGDMPEYTGIRQVPPRLKLIRVISIWENLHKTPLEKRNWDGETYSSPKAHISKDVIYAIQPRTNKLFVVFLNSSGTIEIPELYSSADIYQTNDLFIETNITATAIKINGNTMILLDPSQAGKGFIIKQSQGN